jgi:MSHA pilin protein MshD
MFTERAFQHPLPGGSQSGVSLFELVVFIVVVSIAFGTLFSVFNHSMVNSVDPMIKVRALECAQAKLDEVTARKFDENTPTGGVPACGSAETGAVACSGIAVDADFDDIGDYNGQNFVDGDCDVTIAVVGEGTDLGMADDASLVRLITVTSTMPDGNTVMLSAYHTNF